MILETQDDLIKIKKMFYQWEDKVCDPENKDDIEILDWFIDEVIHREYKNLF